MSRSQDEQQPNLSEWEIIGTTLSAASEELPMRLRPVLRTRSAPHSYALLYDGEGDEESLVPEDPARVEALFAEERFYRFAVPIAPRAGYWLIQFNAGYPPEYLAGSDARARLREEGERALEQSDSALSSGDLALARARAAYASLALEDDPFPCLVLVSLWRGDITASQLEFALGPLKSFSRSQVEKRFREVWSTNRHPALIERIRRDPVHQEYKLRPGWLRASSSPLRSRPVSSLFSQPAEARQAA
jgi:hypothetical protein